MKPIGLSLESLAIFGGSGATGREVVSEALKTTLGRGALEDASVIAPNFRRVLDNMVACPYDFVVDRHRLKRPKKKGSRPC